MEKIEIRDLMNYRFLSGVTAAPEGRRAAFVVKQAEEEKNSYTGDIYLWEDGAVRRLTADGKSGSPIWEDATHLLFPAMRDNKDSERAKKGESLTVLYRLDIHGGEAVRAYELPIAGAVPERLTDKLWFFMASIDVAHPDEYKQSKEEREQIAKERKENEDYHFLTDGVYRFNGAGFCENRTDALFTWEPETGKLTRVTDETMDMGAPFADGDSILFIASRRAKTAVFHNQLYRYTPATGVTETLYGGDDYGFHKIIRLGGSILALGDDGKTAGLNQNASIYRVENGALTLIASPDVAYGSSVGSDCRLGGGRSFRIYKDNAYFTCTVGGATQLRKLDESGRMTTINRADGSLDCFDILSDGTMLGVGLYDNRPQELYCVGRGSTVTRLTDFNTEALKGKYVAVPHALSARSHGKRIDGWVLEPKDYDPDKRYPAVLDIHGGPKTVYGTVFVHEMQVWASRGYFVFFCNPTGSDGRGDAFMDIRGKYGSVDYENIMDFTDAVLKAYPQIDSARLAVTGGSYGGFMTNWIIGHTDRFACAATQRSISNWFSFYGVSDIGPYFAKDQTAGDMFTDEGMKRFWAQSPLRYVRNAVTPTLFIHSDEDYRCPIDQGLQLYAALLEKGVDTRFVWFKGENHELSRSGKPKHRVKRLEEITAWIEKYTKK